MNHIIPWNFQIEMTQGCNRLCKFCGLWAIWSKPEDRKFGFMTEGLADALSKDMAQWIKKGRRIEFAMHGEPTLNPNCLEIIKLFRKNYPQSQYQLATNGVMVKQKGSPYIKELFDTGLNILVIDTYDDSYENFLNIANETGIQVIDYYANKTKINIYGFNSNKLKVICLLGDLGEMNKKKITRVILNHAGNSNPDVVPSVATPLNKTCTRVFREMTVHFDGTVPMCCLDWRHEFIMGKFPEESMESIWNKDVWEMMRQQLYLKNRKWRPCYSCDYKGGFRVGFLKHPNLTSSPEEMSVKINAHLDNYEQYMHANGRKERNK